MALPVLLAGCPRRPVDDVPAVPVIVTQPLDTAQLNTVVRNAIYDQMDRMRPLLDSLRNQRVEIGSPGGVSEESKTFSRVAVYYGTDRQPRPGGSAGDLYGAQSGDRIRWGIAHVSI